MQCQALIQSLTQCLRNANLNSDYCWQHQPNLNNIPTSVIPLITQYNTIPEINILNKSYKHNSIIYQYKHCANINGFMRGKLKKLYRVNPYIKHINIFSEDNNETDLYDQEVDTFDILPIAQFFKLESLFVGKFKKFNDHLQPSLVYNQFIMSYISKIGTANWSLLKNLQELRLCFLPITGDHLKNIVMNLQNLNRLRLLIYPIEESKTDWIAGRNLKMLELTGIGDLSYILKHFIDVTHLNYDYEIPESEKKNTGLYFNNTTNMLRKFRSLESLTTKYFTFLNYLDTNKLRYLNFKYQFRVSNNYLRNLDFSNLEYLGVDNLAMLPDIDYKQIPKLQFLYISIIISSRIDKKLPILMKMKEVHPNLIFNFKNICILPYELRDNTEDWIMETIDKLKDLFTISQLERTINNSGAITYTKKIPTKPSLSWFKRNGYYIPDHEMEFINL